MSKMTKYTEYGKYDEQNTNAHMIEMTEFSKAERK